MAQTPSWFNSSEANDPIIVQGYDAKNRVASSTAVSDYVKPQPPPRSCRDAFWAFLFYAHLGVLAYVTAAFTPQVVNDVAQNANNGGGNRFLQTASSRFLQQNGNDDDQINVDPTAFSTVVGFAGLFAFILSTLGLGFMTAFAETLIKVALWFNILLFGLLAVLSFVSGATPTGLLFLLFCGFSCYYAYRVWSRIPFAASNLVAAISAIRQNLGLAFYAYWSLVLIFLWSIWWSLAFVSTMYVVGNCNAQGQCQSNINGGLVFAFLISYYWTIQVISNVVHCTTAGTVGEWWFRPMHASGCCSKAVRQSYIRSLTTSFGSICLGSLIVAILQAVKEMLHTVRENGDSFTACCAECIIGCIESLVEYFNKWAFVYVGLYGFSFMEAGSNVMELFRARGWTSIISDLMVDTVLFMVSLGVGIVTALLSLVVGSAMSMADTGSLSIAFAIGFVVGYALCSTLFSIVSSAVNSVIVLYAEAPNEFESNHPDLSRRMRESWRQAWPNQFHY